MFYRYFFYAWIFQQFYSEFDFFKEKLILPTIKNTSISTELDPSNSLLIFSTRTKDPDREWGSADCNDCYHNTVVNRPVSGKLRQSSTVSSQC